MWRAMVVEWDKMSDETKGYVIDAIVSADTLDKLAIAEMSKVSLCARIIENPHTMVETLELLAKKGNCGTRMILAEFNRTPVEALMMLALDSEKCVRDIAMANPNLPEDMRAQLNS